MPARDTAGDAEVGGQVRNPPAGPGPVKLKHVAWLLCLPFRPRSKVLFLSPERGGGPALLSRLGHEVVEADSAGAGGWDSGLPRQRPSGGFDAVIVHGDFASATARGSALLHALSGLTAPHAFIWLGRQTRRRRRTAPPLSAMLRFTLQAWRIGLRLQALYELYPSYAHPFELVTLHGAEKFLRVRTAPSGRRSGVKGLIKALVPCWLRTVCLSPGVGVLLCRGSSPGGEPFLAGLLREAAGDEATVVRFISGNPDTLILIYQARGDSYVLKLPFSEAASRRCETNGRILLQIASARLPVPAPALVAVGAFNGFRYFVEQKLEGEAVDTPDYPVGELVDAVFDFLVQFNRSTAARVTSSPGLVRGLVAPYLGLLQVHGDSESARLLGWCAGYLDRELANRTVPLVFFHGDLKLENVLVRVRQRSVCGVIDWDLAASRHLPALDLLHLLAYERTVLFCAPVEETVRLWLAQGFDGRSAGLIRRYCAIMELEPELLRPLLLVYVLHHFAERTDLCAAPAEFVTSRVNPVLASFARADRCGAGAGGVHHVG